MASFYTPAKLFFPFAGLLASFYMPAKLLFSICRFIGGFLYACKPSFLLLQEQGRLPLCLQTYFSPFAGTGAPIVPRNV
ncbi:hypothetical protein QA612_03975 [Evansella sp. AB-P1]|uniref:hypothetical protein n=1 Tax=Evansella sp. AB-P1 TaxID=3037653 RepID=UPI00241D5A75|nr:hypothetical protein [Evansella sp. AB-P1]MDG5786637.1 hypothetical protein [Evansella sp. AB-P1]